MCIEQESFVTRKIDNLHCSQARRSTGRNQIGRTLVGELAAPSPLGCYGIIPISSDHRARAL